MDSTSWKAYGFHVFFKRVLQTYSEPSEVGKEREYKKKKKKNELPFFTEANICLFHGC